MHKNDRKANVSEKTSEITSLILSYVENMDEGDSLTASMLRKKLELKNIITKKEDRKKYGNILQKDKESGEEYYITHPHLHTVKGKLLEMDLILKTPSFEVSVENGDVSRISRVRPTVKDAAISLQLEEISSQISTINKKIGLYEKERLKLNRKLDMILTRLSLQDIEFEKVIEMLPKKR